MNKQNKLARNAIRARKAKNKRANEQDKPKKGKRWLIRLGALVGCLLLVSALVVPCFADDVDLSDTLSDPTPNDYSDYLITQVIDSASVGVYGNFKQYFGDTIVNKDFFIGGVLQDTLNVQYFRFNEPEVNYLQFHIECYVSFVVDGVTWVPCDSASIWIEIISDDETAQLNLHVGLGTNEYIDINYSGPIYSSGYPVLNLISVISSIEGHGTNTNITDSNIEIGFIGDYNYYGVNLEQQFTLLAPFVGQEPIYIRQGYDAYSNGYNAGFESGQEFGFDDGYDYGYEQGYNFGETNGFAAGQKAGYESAVSSGAAFQAGYDQAVSEIDSDEFGRNFLIGVFNAPMDALNEFTIASWQTSDGQTMRVTLGLVLGSCIGIMIFMWFLKMFAGG